MLCLYAFVYGCELWDLADLALCWWVVLFWVCCSFGCDLCLSCVCLLLLFVSWVMVFGVLALLFGVVWFV